MRVCIGELSGWTQVFIHTVCTVRYMRIIYYITVILWIEVILLNYYTTLFVYLSLFWLYWLVRTRISDGFYRVKRLTNYVVVADKIQAQSACFSGVCLFFWKTFEMNFEANPKVLWANTHRHVRYCSHTIRTVHFQTRMQTRLWYYNPPKCPRTGRASAPYYS